MQSEPAPGADPQHVDALAALAVVAESHCGTTVVIAIDGPSGSGKTSLAIALARRLPAPVIHLDDLYAGWDGLADGSAVLAGRVLEPLSRGERGSYRRYDWVAGDWAETVQVCPVPILVVEGCGSSVLPAGDYAGLRVWVEAPREVRLARGIARDGEAYRPHWQRWAAQETELFARDRTRERADLVCWTGDGDACRQ